VIMECATYRVSGTSESALSAYNCTAYESYCTTYLCDDVSHKRVDFCRDYNNISRNPGGTGGTCMERHGGANYAREYCKVGDRIETAGECSRDNLQNFYDELAEAYCKGAGKSKAWCSCYNVTNKVCDTDPVAAGCSDKRQTYDKLIDATPQDYKNSWSGMEACFGGVCIGKNYKPSGYNTNCNRPVQICDFNFDFQSMADSQINTTCNIGDGGGGGEGGGVFGFNFPLLNDKNKQFGAIGAFVILLVLCLAIILVIVGISGSGNKSPKRFKR